MWTLALYMPGEEEIALLSRLGATPDVRPAGVIDPSGMAIGTPVAEVLGWPIHISFQAAQLDSKTLLVGPIDVISEQSPLATDLARHRTMTAAQFLTLYEAGEQVQPVAEPAPEPATPSPAPPQIQDPLPQTDLNVSRTLDRIDEALDREVLMPWLLSLSMEGSAAQGGSLMLFDPTCDELFIAVAKGLRDVTVHTTRVGLGESIAGRVAQNRQAELVLTRPEQPGCDRHDIISALSSPLIWNDELLGVINVNRDSSNPPLTDEDLTDFADIALRIARILHRSEGVARTMEGSIRHRLTHHMVQMSEDADSLESALAGWAGALSLDLEAQSVSLAVVREDGTLLVAEGDQAGVTRVGTLPQTHPAWNDVLQSRKRVVARQAEAGKDDEELTLFFLPIGSGAPEAILGLTFDRHSKAHRFQGRANAVVDLIEHRLPSLLGRFRQQNQLSRQNDLTEYLTSLDNQEQNEAARLASFRVALARGVGVRHAAILVKGQLLAGTAYVPQGVAPEEWASHAAQLLRSVDYGKWINTTLSPGQTDDPDASLLVVPSPGHSDTGLVLIGKGRHDQGDSNVFNSFDAELALRFARVLPQVLRSRTVHETSTPDTDATVDQQIPESIDHLETQLRREMDRSERYHVAFSLSAFRLPAELESSALEALVKELQSRLRSSDAITLLPDGITLILAPEETNSVSHLETRVVAAIRDLLDRPTLAIRHGRAIFPGPFSEPGDMIRHALDAMS
jgi:hypothetical protein